MKLFKEFEKFDIAFDDEMQKYFIISKNKEQVRPIIGSFETWEEAFKFGSERVWVVT